MCRLVVVLLCVVWAAVSCVFAVSSTADPVCDRSIVAFYGVNHICPAGCLRNSLALQAALPSSSASSQSTLPAVYGSFPYHSSSSACLAAVHAGVIDDAVGGNIQLTRFFRHDWSNSSTQTIFPFTSSTGTYSNGVQSVDVPASWYSVPSSAAESSWVVRGRGDRFVQHRIAPFSPRAGHGQSMYTITGYGGREVLLVMGGYNATHYLNDVWLRVRSTVRTLNGTEWYRLPDTPFTPRADFHLTIVETSVAVESMAWLVLGGQTGHMCGLRELGVCTDEVWRLAITVSGWTILPSVNATWSTEPTARLPTTHCGAAVRFFDATSVYVFGGQHSYNDSSCSTAPLYSDDVWHSQAALAEWSRAAEPYPFSSRRFLPLDSSTFATVDSHLVSLASGPVITSVRSDGNSTARITAVTLFADVWRCTVLDTAASCNWTSWHTLAPSAGGHIDMHDIASTSDTVAPLNWWGGYTSRSFIEQFRNTLPTLADDFDVNLAELAVNLTMTISYPSSDTVESRSGLPVNTTLSEAEVNDAEGDYVLGSAWQQWAMEYDHKGLAFTLHEQPYAFADQPSNASLYVPQAASSLNTSRPALNFPLRRVDGRSSGRSFPAQVIVTGGRSGATYYNDVIEYDGGLWFNCWGISDLSWRSALGPLQEIPQPEDCDGGRGKSDSDCWDLSISFAVCPPQYHWEPPSLNQEVRLKCMANVMWMERTTRTIPRCAKDVLTCPFPLQDLGGVNCEPMLPIIDSMHASYTDQYGTVLFMHEASPWTLVDAPVVAGVQLTIVGLSFLEPVRVMVGSVLCDGAELVEPGLASSLPSVCYNVTVSADGTGPQVPQCGRYASSIVCTLSSMVAVNLSVQVWTGRMGAVSAVSELAWALDIDTATLSTMAPQLLSVESKDCSQEDALRLSACPFTRAFNVTVCAMSASIGGDTSGSSNVALVSTFESRPIVCSSWEFEYTDACMQCTLQPWLASTSIGLRRAATNQQSASSATLSFQPCGAGTRINPSALLAGDFANACTPCPPGWSTNNVSGTDTCVPCPPGFFSDQPGAAVCSPCQPGHYAAAYSSSACLACPLNAYSNSTGRSMCETCELDHYIVYDDARQRGVAGHCEECPAGTSCFANGTVSAKAGFYLLIDQQAGTVRSLACSASACVSGGGGAGECAEGGVNGAGEEDSADWADEADLTDSTDSTDAACPMPPTIGTSGLPVTNRCAAGRWPAYVAEYAGTALADTRGFNVLCASCLPGHSVVSGRCIACESTAYGALVGVTALALLLVYCVHRLPYDWTGSATLLISSYFVQQSVLFVAASSLPQLLSLVNMDLLGDHVSRGSEAAGEGGLSGYGGVCIVPLSDAGRIVLALVSPLIAFALLAVVAALDGAAWLAVEHTRAAGGGTMRRLYRWLFVPSSPRLRTLVAGAGGVSSAAVADTGTDTATGTGAVAAAVAGYGLSQPLVADADHAGIHSDAYTHSDAASVSRPPLLPGGPRAHLLCYQRSAVRLVQLSYTSLSVTALSFFELQSVGEWGARVVDYPSLSPSSGSYRLLLPVMCGVLGVVVCGLPVLLAAWLLACVRRGELQAAKRVQQLGSGGDVVQSARQHALLQLCGMFRPRYWWMASFLLVRRLLLVALLVSIRSSHVWTWLSLVNCCLLAAHLQLQPYERHMDNTLESLTLLSLTVQTTLLSVWPPPYRSAALAGVLNTLLVAPLLSAALAAVTTRWREHQASKRRTSGASDWDEGGRGSETS